MTKADFSKYAMENKLESGEHCVILLDGTIKKFTIGVDSYLSIWETTVFTNQPNYQNELRRALLKESTLFEKFLPKA